MITDPTCIFLIVLGIILFAPMLLERLRIPSIVGMIFAGVLVGPHGFGVLARDGSFELFGKVGLYYIMFLASLEMNLQDVQRIKGRALTLGLLSFVIPMVLGYAANSLLLGYGIAAAVLMAAMYASHTLISYPIVLRYGLSKLQSVSIAVGGTIVADTLTLLVLAVVGGTFKENATGLYWVWLVLKVVGLGAVIVYAFPRISRWFFRRYDESVVQYVFVLCLVFLGAALMELVGMEGILGAFLVGLVLNRLIPPSSPLMNHIEFVGNALFIPYFLIGVGMLINLGALFSSLWGIVVALVMVAVAASSKWLSVFITQKLFRLTVDDRRMMFGLTGSRAAATLAVVLVGYGITLPNGSRLLGEEVLNGAMLLILASCVASSFITESTARRMKMAQAVALASATKNSGDEEKDRILIAVRYPEMVPALMDLALMLRTPHSVAPMIALNIVLDDAPAPRQQGEELLEHAERIAASADIRMQTYQRWSVNVVSGITHTVKERAVSDLVIGLHQKARLSDSFYGKLITDLLASVHRQIFIFRASIPLNTIRRIQLLVPPRAEFEGGFPKWVKRLSLLAQQTTCGVSVYSTHATAEAVSRQFMLQQSGVPVQCIDFSSWDDFIPIANQSHQDHLMVFVSARRGTISHNAYLDRMPTQIERCFSSRNVLIVYPDQPYV